ncbi:Nisin resistance protein [Weissella fabalis]|uniref:Nisin resistance protein n=2 Tax=Periweissella fabalis TaxID=1070421 RepID=A0A7X6N345_9LACO|nr:S41 family peptidase [Periweissella fabalis]MCM0598332.1 S41 family peptidase [Periweissella fabalis]NKZ24986.1 Nisin resistance protein [Periweissella fabalis]
MFKKGVFLKKRKLLIPLAVSLLVILSGGIYIGYQYGPNFNFYLVPPTPKRDAMYALNRILSTGIYSENQTQKNKLRKISNEISKKNNYKEIYPLLEQALLIKGGKHSSLVTPKETKKDVSQYKEPTVNVKNNILYVHLPEFVGSKEQAKKYATTVYHGITKQKYIGVIIDLSNNRGGDIGPMLAGISPIIPNGKLFETINADDKSTTVTFQGSVTNNMGTKIDLGKVKKVTKLPVAVILNRWTASSGELTILALKNNLNVKTFGSNSAGYTSINNTYTMYNGTQLNITTDKIKKNNGQVLFNKKIKPDIMTEEPLVKAKEWVANHN